MAIGAPGVIVLPTISNQNVWLPVSDTAPDGTPINPTGGSVEVAYTKGNDPTTWGAGAWESAPITIGNGTYYLVRIGTGTGGLAIPKGFWLLYVKMNFTSPATILRHSSILMY